ncbi:MAG: YciI family protein [Rikenellaceae bacterium]|nr:YciI family protein [Rikenellaceae bacterium]
MFIISLQYTKPIEDVEKVLPEHIEYLDRYFDSGVFFCAGRKIPRTGGIIIGEAGSMEEM